MRFLEVYIEATKKILGKSKRQSKPWIRKKINERKEAKLKMENTRSLRLKENRKEQYKAKDKEVKRVQRRIRGSGCRRKLRWLKRQRKAVEAKSYMTLLNR